ncbi:MAG: hypothetical protein OEZ38_01090 [Gammaproteobacteria bacterium]|nr:hypothetical protein [Gammaproteobacteria bacterium]
MNMSLIGLVARDIKVFMIIIICSVIIVGITNLYYKDKDYEKAVVEKSYENIKKKFDEAVNSRKRIEIFKGRFIKLKELGIDGVERRLNWISTIESTTEKRGIPYVKYKISSQAVSNDQSLAQKYKDIGIYKSTMDLEMHLLHEGDLYTITDDLDRKAKGLFDINSCEISRVKKNTNNLVMEKNDRNFIAKCTLNWYTMKDKGA